MKQNAGKKRRELILNEGDLVYLKLHPQRQHPLLQTSNRKLFPRYAGPFLIIKKISDVAYQLKLTNDAPIHDVFHVSLLKPALGRTEQANPNLIHEVNA